LPRRKTDPIFECEILTGTPAKAEVKVCSEYQTKTSPKEIEKALGVSIIDKTKDFDWGKTVKFYTEAPVLQKNKKEDVELVLRTFPSSPMPNSRLSGLEGQSDGGSDAEDVDEKQIKRIYEMKYWKDGFAHAPLLVPISEFTEFSYWGEDIGTAHGFKIPKEKVMFVAAIGIKPFTPKGPPNSAFSLLTHTATEQMLEYHHRLIVLLEKDVALEYLEDMTVEERFNFLIKNRYQGPLEVHKVRNMAKGWEKRIDTQERKKRHEMKYRHVLEANDVSG
jgi:putative SOS response-associated peptidase YedK